MRTTPHSCYILHNRPYRETSLLVDVFSRQYGRVALVARGARRRQSGQAALIQPFRRLSIAWSARGELGTLTSIESELDPGQRSSDKTIYMVGTALLAGLYVNELVMRLLHRDEAHPHLFDEYSDVIYKLVDTEAREPALRLFEACLLESIGYGLILDHDIGTDEPIIPDRLYEYVSEHGPAEFKNQNIMPAWGYARIHGRTLADLAAETLQDAQSLREAKALLRQEIARHLGGRPLASRDLYQAYLSNQRNARD